MTMRPFLLRQHDNVTTTVMQLKMTHLIIFIVFLSNNFPQNLEFCPLYIPTSEIQFQDLKYPQFGDESPHIWWHCSWRCLQFWRNYVKNITKTLKTSKISRIIYCHHCCHCHHHIVATILSWPSMLLLLQCCDNPMSMCNILSLVEDLL